MDFFWIPTPLSEQLNRIEALLNSHTAILQELQKGESTVMADITALTAQVTQNTSVEASAVQLIQNIAAQLANTPPTQAAIDALTAQLTASAAVLAKAITDNTPAAPAPTPAVA